MAANVKQKLKPARFGRDRQVSPESPDAQRTRVRWTRLVVGVLVMLASMVGVWLLVESRSSSVEVWVARERIDAGSSIAAGDLVARKVESDSQLFAYGTEVPMVGRVVRVTIPAGATLVDGHFFSDDDELGTAGGALSQVSVAFEFGRIPSLVAVNDLLRIQVVSDNNNDEGEPEIFDQVPVVLVQRSERGPLVVTLEVGVDEGDRLLGALASGEAWAAIVGRR